MTEPDPLLRFSRRPPLADALRPPTLIVIGLGVAIPAGVLLGVAVSPGPLAYRAVRGIFFASAFAYLVLSLFDFWEHFRLEKAATGRWWSMSVLPPGETLNHIATAAVADGVAPSTVEIEVAAQVAPRGFSGLLRQGAANGERCQEG
jgi:hypothetical protein